MAINQGQELHIRVVVVQILNVYWFLLTLQFVFFTFVLLLLGLRVCGFFFRHFSSIFAQAFFYSRFTVDTCLNRHCLSTNNINNQVIPNGNNKCMRCNVQ